MTSRLGGRVAAAVLALGAVTAVGVGVLAYATGGLTTRLPFVTHDLLFHAPILLFIVAVAVAVLHYRLHDIDRIVSRTVTYAALSGLPAAAYLAFDRRFNDARRPVGRDLGRRGAHRAPSSVGLWLRRPAVADR